MSTTPNPPPATAIAPVVPADFADIIAVLRRLYGHDLHEVRHPQRPELALPYAIVPEGRTIQSLKPVIDSFAGPLFNAAPVRIAETVTLTSVESFTDWTMRFANAATALFAQDDPAAPGLTAIIDHHDRTDPTTPPVPAWGVHRGVYRFPLSAEFQAWRAIAQAGDDGFISQAAFAVFLGEHQWHVVNPPADWAQVDGQVINLLLDVLNLQDDIGAIDDDAAEPDGARQALAGTADLDAEDDHFVPRSAIWRLRQIRFGSRLRIEALARGVKLTVKGSAAEAFNPRTGERQLQFEEEHEVSGAAGRAKGRKLTVPDGLLISVPVFEGEDPVLMPVWLYYRLDGGRPVWKLELVNAPMVVRQMVRRVAHRLRTDTGLPIYFGTPGAAK